MHTSSSSRRLRGSHTSELRLKAESPDCTRNVHAPLTTFCTYRIYHVHPDSYNLGQMFFFAWTCLCFLNIPNPQPNTYMENPFPPLKEKPNVTSSLNTICHLLLSPTHTPSLLPPGQNIPSILVLWHLEQSFPFPGNTVVILLFGRQQRALVICGIYTCITKI